MKTRSVQYDNLEQSNRVFGAWQRKTTSLYGMHRTQHLFLILTKDPGCKRGEYSEELDVLARTGCEAKKIAQAVLDHDYEPVLRISRVVWRGQR